MCTFPPPVKPISVSFASPGPFTTHPIIETVMNSEICSSLCSTSCTVLITSNCCLVHEGQEITVTPLLLSPNDLSNS